jgi:hypothetical protein
MNRKMKRAQALVAGATVAGALATGIAAAGAQPAGTTSTTGTSTSSTTSTTILDVEPTHWASADTVAAGDAFTVSGSLCTTDGVTPGKATVWITSEGGPVTDRFEGTRTSGGRWSAVVTVPAGLHPGEYPVSAQCEPGGGRPSWFYTTQVTIHVVAGPEAPKPKPNAPKAPKAVKAKPRFTG